MEQAHGTPEFVRRRADLGCWAVPGGYLPLKERLELSDRYARVWARRRAQEQAGDLLAPVRAAIREGVVHLHYKGGRYRPLLIAKNSDDHTQERVIYVSLTHGTIWDRTLFEWADVVRWPDGKWRRRFVARALVPLDEEVRLEVLWKEQTQRAAEAEKERVAKEGWDETIAGARILFRKEDACVVPFVPHPGVLEEGASRGGPRAANTIEALARDIDFWKRMLIRKYCGCLVADCGVHGAYDPDEAERVHKLEGINAIQVRSRGVAR